MNELWLVPGHMWPQTAPLSSPTRKLGEPGRETICSPLPALSSLDGLCLAGEIPEVHVCVHVCAYACVCICVYVYMRVYVYM